MYEAGTFVEYNGPDEHASMEQGTPLLILSTRQRNVYMVQVQAGALMGAILYLPCKWVREHGSRP